MYRTEKILETTFAVAIYVYQREICISRKLLMFYHYMTLTKIHHESRGLLIFFNMICHCFEFNFKEKLLKLDFANYIYFCMNIIIMCKILSIYNRISNLKQWNTHVAHTC